MKNRNKYLNWLWIGFLVLSGMGIFLTLLGESLENDRLYYTGVFLLIPLLLLAVLAYYLTRIMWLRHPIHWIYLATRWVYQKHRKPLLALVSVLLAVSVFFTFFKIEKQAYCADCITAITVPLNQVVKHEMIYPTELLSVDLTDKTASIQVKFPKQEWRQFKGREKENFEEIGYYLETIADDHIDIRVPFPENGYHYYMRYRWE